MRQALFKDGIINLMNNIQLLLNASSVLGYHYQLVTRSLDLSGL